MSTASAGLRLAMSLLGCATRRGKSIVEFAVPGVIWLLFMVSTQSGQDQRSNQTYSGNLSLLSFLQTAWVRSMTSQQQRNCVCENGSLCASPIPRLEEDVPLPVSAIPRLLLLQERQDGENGLSRMVELRDFHPLSLSLSVSPCFSAAPKTRRADS